MPRPLLSLLATALSAFAVSAHATDGTVDFQGSVYLNTCFASVNGVAAPGVATVTLPTLSTSLLATSGKTAGDTTFKINLTGCPPSIGKPGQVRGVIAFFEQNGFVDGSTGLLKNTGTATNVRLQLVDAFNGTPIRAGDEIQKSNSTRYAVSYPDGTAELHYAVRYYAVGTTTAGTVRGAVTYSLDYI